MAKYDVTHSCGHTRTHNIDGKISERQGRADWLARHVCDECQQAAYAEQNAKASATATELNLSALKGSEKQVAWASSIRLTRYGQILKHLEDNAARLSPDMDLQAAATTIISAETSAGWWINNRDPRITPAAIINAIMTTHQAALQAALS